MPEVDPQQMIDLVTPYAIKVALALAIYIIGKWLVKVISSALEKAMGAKNVDPTISKFVGSIVYYLMFAFVIIAALGQLGVQTASVVAIVGAAGLAVGFALQGTLSNFAAGVMLILLRPIKVGDFVEVGGSSGSVKEVAIFATTLLTGDNKTVIISNSAVMGGNITNYSTTGERRVDLVVGVSYDANIQQVKDELKALADGDVRVLKDKDVTIGVVELADSSVNLVFRPWVKSADYWGVYFDFTERIKTRFDELGIEIPYPQMDIHSDKAA